jgi:hypothetical protein
VRNTPLPGAATSTSSSAAGHFNSHRAGREVRVVVTPGRLR